MGRIKSIELSETARAALEYGHQHGASHAFRRRCQMILLKAQGRPSRQVAQIVGGCPVVVNNWLHRYEQEGIAGLKTKPGRGRPPILQEGDKEAVLSTVKEHRQRLSLAQAELEQSLNKGFCQETLRRFVKKTVDASSVCASDHAVSRSRKFTNSKSRA